MAMHKVLHPRDYMRQTLCQENKAEEDLPALKIASIQRYTNSKSTLKRAKTTNYSEQNMINDKISN